MIMGGNMMEDKITITQKSVQGEDGYKVFSIRIKADTLKKLDDLSKQSRRSRNEVITLLLDFAIERCEIKPLDDE